MLNWPPKDPDATLDYRWEPPLDLGDTLTSASISIISGDVAIASQISGDTDLRVVLSGGTVGANLFRGVWASAGGRSGDEYIGLQIADNLPTAGLVAALKTRYTIFAPVPDATVQLFLDDALSSVTAFGEDADKGQMLKAAHDMIVANMPGIIKTAAEQLPAGVTKFKSASMDVSVSEASANRSLLSGYASTWFGQEFAKLQRRYLGGPRLVGYVEPLGICWS